MSGARVLLVDDDPGILRAVARALVAADYRVETLATGSPIPDTVRRFRPEVILLDLVLPDSDGVDVCRDLRTFDSTPVIVLSAVGDDRRKVEALDAGADDYVQKPFSVGELLARVRVALRHAATTTAPAPAATMTFGDNTIDLVRREVHRKGELVHLTPMEYKLLAVLVKHAGLVLTHRQLLREVWGPGNAEESQYLRLYMHQLRQKLEENSSRPKHLITETGIGYRLRIE